MELNLDFTGRRHMVSITVTDYKKSGITSMPDFFSFCEERLCTLSAQGRYSSLRSVRALLRKLSKFTCGKRIRLKDIDAVFLHRFEEYLIHVAGNSHNTVVETMKAFSKLVSDYIQTFSESGAGWPDRRTNPFETLNLTRCSTSREFLLEEEFERIMALRIPAGSPDYHARNLFLMECQTGLRISDLLLLRWGSVRNGAITLVMQKTRYSVSIPLTRRAMLVLDSYRNLFSLDDCLVFPNLRSDIDFSDSIAVSKAICSATGMINKRLKSLAVRAGIKKNISSHTGRHSFATMLITKGASIYDVKELLGHRDIKVTQIYAHITDSRKQSAIALLE